MKPILTLFLLSLSCNATAAWVEFSAKSNGDVFFYDNAHVEKADEHYIVWMRVRYKRSVMGALSFQSLLKIDCAENSETVLQSTFYTDGNWNKPAMATNKNVKPKTSIEPNSPTGQLVDILCKS